MKPKVFVGSSVENLRVAYAIQQALEYTAEVTVWSQGVFQLSSNTLDDLLLQIEESDFGIFVFSPEDLLVMRGASTRAVRDNVVFEFGLFIGKLGKSRTFFIVPRSDDSFHLPSDLAGVTPASYDDERDNLEAALGPACTRIQDVIRKAGPRASGRPRVPDLWKPFIEEDPLIVLGRFQEFSDFEQSGFLGVGDAFALNKVEQTISLYGGTKPKVDYDDRLDGQSLNRALVLIGGPVANSVTDRAVQRIATPFNFGDPKKHQISMVDKESGQTFMPEYEGDTVVSDYGIILRTKNPFNPKLPLLVLFGCFGYGTWAAAEYACSGSVENCDIDSWESFECLVHADIIKDTPLGIKGVLCRSLGHDVDAIRTEE